MQLQIGSKDIQPGMQRLKRIIQQQWYSISNLSETIIDMCKQKLQDVDISVEVQNGTLLLLLYQFHTVSCKEQGR